MAKRFKNRNRSRYKAIAVGDLTPGSYLAVCKNCGQEFIVGSGTPKGEIIKAHQQIKNLDHVFEQGLGLV